MADTAVVKTQTLEERITARLHDSIGDLITDADLAKIVERGIERALFETRVTTDYYNRQTVNPSLVDRLVEKFLGEKMAAAVDAWLTAHPERIQQAVDDAIAKGAGAAFIRYLDDKFAGIFTMGVGSLQAQGLLPQR